VIDDNKECGRRKELKAKRQETSICYGKDQSKPEQRCEIKRVG
jgi:hypothetical protein